MPTFLGIHNMGENKPEEQIQSAWEAYKAACQKLDCSGLHVHYNAAQGKAYCLTEATSADQVQKAHDEAQVPLTELLEVKTQD